MPLLVNTKHTNNRTLKDIYRDLKKDKSNPVWEKRGDEMLGFIDMVDEMFTETTIWALTSHLRLVLQTEDDWRAKWFVIISCIGSGEYYFEYLMPEDRQPWNNATISGMTTTLPNAKTYLLIAMRESGGWKGNAELERLLIENKLY
jgi:hypothetical protein